ncbi:hypothetical protein Hanom_Chr13g01222521 [Helianthus anomalus]
MSILQNQKKSVLHHETIRRAAKHVDAEAMAKPRPPEFSQNRGGGNVYTYTKVLFITLRIEKFGGSGAPRRYLILRPCAEGSFESPFLSSTDVVAGTFQPASKSNFFSMCF